MSIIQGMAISLTDLTGAELFVFLDDAIDHGGQDDVDAAREELARRGHLAHTTVHGATRQAVTSPSRT